MAQYEPTYDSFRRFPADRYVPTERMSVSASVYLPGSEVDVYTGQLKPDHQRRRRTQGKRLEAERLEREKKALEESLRRESDKGGVRIPIRTGVLVLAVLVFVCGVRLLYQQGQIANRQKEVNRLEKSIEEYRSRNEELETRIAEASDASVVCYAASRNLGMVPAESVTALHLEAVDTRPMTSGRPQTTAALEMLLSPSVPTAAIASK